MNHSTGPDRGDTTPSSGCDEPERDEPVRNQPARDAAPATPVGRSAEPAQATDPAPSPPLMPLIPDGELRSLHPGHVAAERIAGSIFTSIASPVLLAAHLLARGFEWLPAWTWIPLWIVWIGATAGLIWLTVRMPVWEHRHYRYAVHTVGLEIRKGIFWKRVIDMPRSRVQHTDVSQGPLQRKFDIATLTVHTAGTQDHSVQLEGLGHEEALRIRDFLIRAREPESGART